MFDINALGYVYHYVLVHSEYKFLRYKQHTDFKYSVFSHHYNYKHSPKGNLGNFKSIPILCFQYLEHGCIYA